MTTRILVTGSRQWTDSTTIAAAIWCAWGLPTEEHRADWDRHGRGAGPVRNRLMIAAGADVCLAFIRDQSPGATHCADTAETAGIPTHRYRHTTTGRATGRTHR